MKKSKFLAAALAATMFATAACGLVACDKDAAPVLPGGTPEIPSESQTTEYTVTFSGTNVSKVTTNGKLSGTMPKPTSIPENKEFKGWAKTEGAKTAAITASNYTSYEFSGDTTAITLYPVYVDKQQQEEPPTPPTPDEYTITFRAGANGSLDGKTEVTTVKGVAEFPTPDPEDGYVFDHWEDEDGKTVTERTVFTKNTTVTACFEEDEEGGDEEPDYSTDGVYINGKCYELVENAYQTDYINEWWFGSDTKQVLTAGTKAKVYIDGKLVEAKISGSSVGIAKPDLENNYNEFQITTSGNFEVYVREKDDGWEIQFAGPTEVSEGDTLPQGTAIILNCAGNTKIRLYLELNGSPVTNIGDYMIWAWNGGDNLTGGVWPGKTLGASVTLSGSMTSDTKFIISWGNGANQTADLSGMEATTEGNTYLVKMSGSGKSVTSQIEKINVPI